MSLILSPTPSAPSPRANEVMSQGTLACPSSCASTSASKHGRGRTRGVGLEKVLGLVPGRETIGVYPGGRVWRSVFHCCHLSTKIGMLVRGLIPISVNKWLMFCRSEGVHYGSGVGEREMVVETMMTARQMHRNRMHAYFKKFPSKEAALLKPHPDTTEEQWKELCDMFTSEAFMKRSEQNKKNRSKLTVNHAAGSRSFQRTRACMKNQENCKINPAELYKKNYTNKDGVWTSKEQEKFIFSTLMFLHQLAKARDEIEAMRAAKEKDLQEFVKKQAEMEATLRDHREEQRVEQECIRLEQRSA
ncbi:hypothetical protein CJ030_MR7G012031 [Morella rubra]|uniref:Uncharacterized protein n=1 Tax=Morella rubra TaxID=262757 RepID=A0A6A1UYC1_9ROSI|nr:hypothetical protein CJ030_MR7G012031 [Morella rubra]